MRSSFWFPLRAVFNAVKDRLRVGRLDLWLSPEKANGPTPGKESSRRPVYSVRCEQDTRTVAPSPARSVSAAGTRVTVSLPAHP